MPSTTRFKVIWAIWMTAGGVAAALIAYALTGSWGWAVTGLLASGIVLNAIGQVIVQPARALGRGSSHPAQRGGTRRARRVRRAACGLPRERAFPGFDRSPARESAFAAPDWAGGPSMGAES